MKDETRKAIAQTIQEQIAEKERAKKEAEEYRRLTELRQTPCWECRTKPSRLAKTQRECIYFALVKCEVCGHYFCCSHIMGLAKQDEKKERLGICRKCWDKSPETEEVRDEWKSAHIRFGHGITIGDCFIATAVLITTSSPALADAVLQDLRRFRDTWLTKRAWGKLVVKLYYQIGPWVATRLRGHRSVCGFFKSVFIGPMHSLVAKESSAAKALRFRLGVVWGATMMAVSLVVALFMKPRTRHRY